MTYKHLLSITNIAHAVRVLLVLALLQHGIVHPRSVLHFCSISIVCVCIFILIVRHNQFFLLIAGKLKNLARCLSVKDHLESMF